jgi:MFS family permease
VQAGLVGSVLAGTAFVLRIPAGVLVDRWNRRRIMVWADVGRAANSLGFAIALGTGHFWFPHVLAVAFVEAALGVLFGPAESAAVRRVVGRAQAREAVASNAARGQLPGLFGPMLGGALLAAGRSWPFLADAATYLVSLACVLAVRASLRTERLSAPRRPVREALDGVGWIRDHRFLRSLLLLFAAFGLPTGGLGLLVLVLAREHGAGAAQLGAMFTLTALGGAAGAVLTPRLVRSMQPITLIVAGTWAFAAATLALAVLGDPIAYGAAGAVAFFFVGPLNALAFGVVAAEAPDELQGRVTSASIQVATLGAPVAPALAGVLLKALDATSVAVLYGCVCAALALAATLSRSLRPA